MRGCFLSLVKGGGSLSRKEIHLTTTTTEEGKGLLKEKKPLLLSFAGKLEKEYLLPFFYPKGKKELALFLRVEGGGLGEGVL